MGRRASSSLNPATIIGIVVVLAVLIGGGLILMKGKKESFEGVPLNLADFLSNANALRGNEYKVEGKVFRRDVRDSGEAVGLLVETPGGGVELVFLTIPPEVEHVNIERDQKYAFKIRIGEDGVPIATGVKRL